MLQSINPTQTESWKKLEAHFEEMKQIEMKDLFAEDGNRFEKFSTQFNDILIDYSKNIITEETLSLLQELAKECGVQEAIASMFGGSDINQTEGRAVLHTALRNKNTKAVLIEGLDVMPDVKAALLK